MGTPKSMVRMSPERTANRSRQPGDQRCVVLGVASGGEVSTHLTLTLGPQQPLQRSIESQTFALRDRLELITSGDRHLQGSQIRHTFERITSHLERPSTNLAFAR